jgi:hypothetical protein
MPVGNLPGVKLHRPLCPVCFRDVNAGSASLRTTLPRRASQPDPRANHEGASALEVGVDAV